MMILDFSKFNGKRPTDLKGEERAQFTRTVAKFMREPLSPEFSKENMARIQAWRAVHDSQHWTDKSDFPSGEELEADVNAAGDGLEFRVLSTKT